ncbi:MAG TPA: alpha/beta hydrolase [Opitutae bacterium]|nr:alpha/beta hydrolase [Opitutaceae bacterium]HCR30864.1 alpha/beta hydrolase [Opitutae bacterium]
MSTEAISLPKAISEIYPFKQNRVRLACGYEMNYVDEGEGHPVLMIHGNPTWSFLYRELIKALRPGFRCIAPDHIGCGLSDKPTSAYRFKLDQRIRDLEDFVDGLGLERFDLVVHDWGGAIGVGMALSRLKNLRRLAILNTAAFVDSRIPRRISLCRAPLLGKLIVQGFNGFASPATRMAVARKPLGNAVKEGYLFPYDSWANRRAVYEFVKDIPMHVSHPSFNRLLEIENGLLQLREKPVALFWGGKDFCFTDHFMDRWKRFLPQATAIHYADAGHYLLEDEGEKICSAIEEFVSYDEDGISDTKLV